jgi:hypothetical protein
LEDELSSIMAATSLSRARLTKLSDAPNQEALQAAMEDLLLQTLSAGDAVGSGAAGDASPVRETGPGKAAPSGAPVASAMEELAKELEGVMSM